MIPSIITNASYSFAIFAISLAGLSIPVEVSLCTKAIASLPLASDFSTASKSIDLPHSNFTTSTSVYLEAILANLSPNFPLSMHVILLTLEKDAIAASIPAVPEPDIMKTSCLVPKSSFNLSIQ